MDPVFDRPSVRSSDLLRAARELQGLSRNELARRLGVSWQTVRQVEEGACDPQATTLARYLDVLPFLTPAGLLLGDATAPPLSALGAWAFHRDRYGFVARRVVLDVRVDGDGRRAVELEVGGVRSLRGSLEDEAVRTNVMQAVVHASSALLKALRADPEDLSLGTRELADGDLQHAFTFARSLRRDGLSYRRSSTESRQLDAALQVEDEPALRSAQAVAWDVVMPVELLELRVRWQSDETPRVGVFVAPNAACPPRGAFALARSLQPAGYRARWDPRHASLVVSIRRPLLELRYGLAWMRHGEPGADRLQPLSPGGRPRTIALGATAGGDSLAGRLAAAREASGLSRRELARRMAVSPATVMEAESGRNPRASTLRRALEQLEALSPQDLFPGVSGAGPIAGDALWLYYRGLWGMEAEAASRELLLTPEGDALEAIETRGLRRLGEPGQLVVKDGIAQAIQGRVGSVFVDQGEDQDEDQAEDQDDLRIRWRRLPNEQPEFLLTIPPDRGGRGASFTRREEKTRTYKMNAEQTARSIGPAFQCFCPVRRLSLSVRFPEGYRPADVQCSVRAAVNITNPRWPDLKDEIHAAGLELELDAAAGLARLVVRRPLLGYRYSIRWRAP